MKAVFIAKIGRTRYLPSSFIRGGVDPYIDDESKIVVAEIETDKVFSEGERIYLPDYDKSPKIESVAHTLDGGYRYTLNFYAELNEDVELYNQAVEESIRKYNELHDKEIVKVTNKIKKIWNKDRKKD